MTIGYIDRANPSKVYTFTGKIDKEIGKIGTIMGDLKGVGNIHIVKLKNGRVVRTLVTRYI